MTWVLAVMSSYVLYAAGALFEVRYDTPVRAAIGTSADAAFFALWTWVEPGSWPPLLAASLLLASAVMFHDLLLASSTAAVALFLSVVLPRQTTALPWAIANLAGLSVAVAVYKGYLDRRMSNTLRHNVIIRSQAEGAREAERQRIAADFHDGPLQSFISFQMRLEILRKLMAKDLSAAASELEQLQDLCRSQVTDLRSFVRSMRPPDEGMSLAASLSRMAEQFQRDTSISASFSSGDIHDPAETEISLEVLQIVREALNNIQKHSGATRIGISIARREGRLAIQVEDNGDGFPFAGKFNLEELELLRLGPISIKRRVKMLNGDLALESRPGQGSKIDIQVPV